MTAESLAILKRELSRCTPEEILGLLSHVAPVEARTLADGTLEITLKMKPGIKPRRVRSLFINSRTKINKKGPPWEHGGPGCDRSGEARPSGTRRPRTAGRVRISGRGGDAATGRPTPESTPPTLAQAPA